MKKALNVTFGAILAAGVISPAFAHFEYQFLGNSAISVTGTYTETSNNGLSIGDYRFDAPSNSSSPDFFGRRAIFIDTDPEFDYALGYTFHFPCTHTRFFLSYDHYRSEDHDVAQGNVVNLGVVPITIIDDGQIQHLFPSDSGRHEIESEEFRIGFSHMLNFGRRLSLDLSAFYEWDKVHRSLFESIKVKSQPDNSFLDIASRLTDVEMEGWGPGVGAMAIVKPFRNLHWGLFMGAKTSLIWADNEFQQTAVHPIDIKISNYLFNPEDSESVVGKLDITFGIDYCTVLGTDIGKMLFEAALGMRYMNMFNALKNGNTFFNPLWPSDIDDNAVNTGYANDWGRIGPFLTFRVGGADA